MPKIINESYELMKLCHVKRSGPVFGDTVYIVDIYHCYFHANPADKGAVAPPPSRKSTVVGQLFIAMAIFLFREFV